MTKQEIDYMIKNDYELIWESEVIQDEDGKTTVVSRPVKILKEPKIDYRAFSDFMLEQEPGYRIFRK